MSDVRGDRGGRRMAVRPARSVDRVAAAGAVLLVLALVSVLLLVGEPESTGSTESTGGGTSAPVEHTVRGCPGLTGARAAGTHVLLGAAPVDDLGTGGALRHAPPADLSSADALPGERGELVRVPIPARTRAGLAVEGRGALAAGLFAFQVRASGSALAVTPCRSPGATWWFTGAGATLDHASELVLDNLDPGRAVVDVNLLGASGELETLGTRGIVVPPGGRVTIALTDLVPQEELLAVQVRTSRGRVVAAVSDSFADAAVGPAGVDWLAAQSAPSRLVRLAGLVPRADEQTLLVANPADREALVDLQVSGPTGTFTPTEGAQIRVPPRTTVRHDVTELVGADPSALLLRSPVRVLASVRSTQPGAVSYAASVAPLTGPAAVPVVRGTATRLQLSAGRRPGRVSIGSYTADGRPTGSEQLDLVPGATTTWRAGRKAAYLVVEPVAGNVFGAAVFNGDGGISSVPLVDLPVEVRQPQVRPVP